MINFIFFFIFHFLVNNLCLKLNFLIDKKETSDHKKKVFNKLKTPLTGGLIFIIYYIFVIPHKNFHLLFLTITMYFVGIISDINYLSSPIRRLFFQSIIVCSLVFISDISIATLSIEILDSLLSIRIVEFLFILLCFLVLINGYNFLDGINTLVLGNFLICLFSIYFISIEYSLYLNFEFVELMFGILLIIFIFNFFGQSFLGDSGSYSISFVIGFICIDFIYSNNLLVSPYYAAALLWYPAIENLFSIMRRLFLKKKLADADNNHLHHYVYISLTNFRTFKNAAILNTLTGIIINCYILVSAYFASINYSHTKNLLIVIFFNTSVYLLTYYMFHKKNLKKK